jgi:hypothetical protein
MDTQHTELSWLVGMTIDHVQWRSPYTWQFQLSNGGTISTDSLWRFISNGRLLLTSEDHNQQFGWPEPLDAESRLRTCTQGKRILLARADPTTSDLRIELEGGDRLEILATSCGYENWLISTPANRSIISSGSQILEHGA